MLFDLVLHRVFVQDFLVTNIIAVAVLAVAVDVNPENVLDGIFVAVEGGSAQRHSLAHLGALPPFVDFGQRDALGAVDGVHQPNVLLEKCGDGHGVKFFSILTFPLAQYSKYGKAIEQPLMWVQNALIYSRLSAKD